ncbi:MAG: hypothetical protein AAF629_05285 [Chloroflexota bacterium]
MKQLFAQTNLSPRQLLSIIIGLLFIISTLSFGSYQLDEKELTKRRGTFSFIPRDYRELFVDYRFQIGISAAVAFGSLIVVWVAAEGLSRQWQRTRNRELAQNAVILRLAPRAEMKMKWTDTAEFWRSIHATIVRSKRDTWLGGGYHLSLEIVQKAGEPLIMYLWTPIPLAQTLMRQLQATYPGLEVEVLQAESAEGANDYLDGLSDTKSLAWADLGLNGDSWRTLRTDFGTDPIVSILSTVSGLSSGIELAGVQMIVRPVSEGWQQGGKAFVSKLRGDTLPANQPRPRLSTADRDQIKRIEGKGLGLGYQLCLRVFVAGQGDVSDNLNRLIYAYSQFDGDTRLAVRKQGDQSEMYRVKGRYLPAGWSGSVVAEKELAALGHLPNREVTGIPIARAGVQIERPSTVSFIAPGEQRITLGMFSDVPSFEGGLPNPVPYSFLFLRQRLNLVEQGNGVMMNQTASVPEVGIKLKDGRRHFHVIGPTGVGKSTMLLNMMAQYMSKFDDAAIWLQEPHQDLTHKVVMRVPLAREKDVIWLDVMDPKRVIGINPLHAPAGADIGSLVADTMGVMRKAMGANWDSAVQMQEILENALLAVIGYQEQPTMTHLFKLLTDENYRFDLTAQIEDPISVSYWQSLEMKKERELDQMFSVPRRRINAFMRNPIVRRIVAQPRSTVNFRQAIDNNKIILIQLDGRMGAQNRTFIGAMMMYQLFGAIMSRMDISEDDRKQVAICVDEFQTFVGQSSDEFADILEQARKMGASLTLAHQHLGQLGELTNSVANNTGTKIVFRAEASDAPTFLKWLPELTTIESLTKMRNYWCYVRPLVNGSPQPVCTLKTFADPPIPDPVEELRTAKRGKPDPLPAHPGQAALNELKLIRQMASDTERKTRLMNYDHSDWETYLAARHYHDAVRRNQLIEQPDQIPDKMERIRTLVRLGYGTPHYETEARVDQLLQI